MLNNRAKRIVLDEKREAEKILSQPPEKYITYKTMLILAKYFYSSLGTSKSRLVKKKLIEYCSKSEYFNLTLRETSIDKAIKKAKLYSLKSFDYRIPITKNEVKKLKSLSHKDYKLALYILFVTKLERYQNIKRKNAKVKTFTPYFFYDIKTAHYNMINGDGGNNGSMSNKEAMETFRRLYKAGIIKPTINRNTIVVICADFENKNTEFIIDASKPFLEQVKYYCIFCGKETENFRGHDFCKECYTNKRTEKEKNRKR